jgi:hypothetical protein
MQQYEFVDAQIKKKGAQRSQMKIVGIEGMTGDELQAELQQGGKFVVFQYCISIIILTFKRPSNIYFVKAGESSVGKGLVFSIISLLFGWWGIPWGPIYTVQALVTNFKGGKDVTQDVLASLAERETA